MSITRKQALTASAFHEDGAVDPQDGHCKIWHSTGHPATWGPEKRYFSVPVVSDAEISGNITEVTAAMYHVDEDCPHGFAAGTSPVAEDFGDGEITDIIPHKMSSGSLGSRAEYKHRILRRQLDEKLNEIQEGLGLTDLQMLEVVAHWMRTKTRDMRDIEVGEET